MAHCCTGGCIEHIPSPSPSPSPSPTPSYFLPSPSPVPSPLYLPPSVLPLTPTPISNKTTFLKTIAGVLSVLLVVVLVGCYALNRRQKIVYDKDLGKEVSCRYFYCEITSFHCSLSLSLSLSLCLYLSLSVKVYIDLYISTNIQS